MLTLCSFAEELIIDFRTIQGTHTGENLAELVWRTLEMYGLVGKIIVFVMDDTSNNVSNQLLKTKGSSTWRPSLGL